MTDQSLTWREIGTLVLVRNGWRLFLVRARWIVFRHPDGRLLQVNGSTTTNAQFFQFFFRLSWSGRTPHMPTMNATIRDFLPGYRPYGIDASQIRATSTSRRPCLGVWLMWPLTSDPP
jgi:hypothetical protein